MIKIPTCEICEQYVNATLRIKLPKIMKKKYSIHGKVKDFRHRKTAWVCFVCIRLHGKSALDFDGLWHKIIFPQMHRTGLRGRIKIH